MNLWSAAAFLVGASMRNWATTQVRRLRRPRYALGLAVVVLYVWSVGARSWMGGAVSPSPQATASVEALLLAVTAVGIASAWVFGGEDAVLRFTQAEVQFLFPAPATRRQLVLYKMGRTLLGSAFTAAMTTLLFAPRVTAHPVWFVFGAWLSLSTVNFHLAAASLTRAMLVDFGLAGIRRRLVTLAVGIAAFGLVGWAALQVAPPPDLGADPSATLRWMTGILREGPLGWVLLPFRASIAVALAQDWAGFVALLPLAVAVLLAHAGWVMSTASAFEDASVADADRRTTHVQVLRRGWSPLHGARAPFRLAGTGRPEVALIWKSLIAAIRTASLRLVLLLSTLGVSSALIGAIVFEGESTGLAIGALVATSLAGYLAVIGAQLLRVDLRLDLAHLDLLRSYPLTGRALVTGEIAGPALVLAALQWACLAAALILGTGWAGEPGPAARVAIAAALAIALPVVSLCGLVVQNGVVLLFPEWAALDAQVGPEALGRRLILLFTNLFLLLFAIVPASFGAAAVFAVTAPWVGVLALPLGAAAGATLVLAEVWVALGRMGLWFESFDLSEVGGLSEL